MYEIVESHVKFDLNGNISEIAVLWKDNDGFRATYTNRKLSSGYVQLINGTKLSPQLLQDVAGGGLYVDDIRKSLYFPNVKNWTR